jgi:hypothetical protein
MVVMEATVMVESAVAMEPAVAMTSKSHVHWENEFCAAGSTGWFKEVIGSKICNSIYNNGDNV